MGKGSSLRSRVADLQIPISQIRTLAVTASQMIGDMSGVEDQGHRDILEHATNFVDLIVGVASRLAQEAESIERDAKRDWGAQP